MAYADFKKFTSTGEMIALGDPDEAAAADPVASASIVALLKGLLVVAGASTVASGSFTRPADTLAYASGDLVANSTVAGSVVPVPLAVALVTGGKGRIRRVRIRKSGTSVANASFRVHLWSVAPAVTGGDNAAFAANGAANYLGAVDVTVTQALNDGAFGAAATDIGFIAAGGSLNLYALVEARAAYTPVSAESFTVAIEATQG
ncbi:MAG: hypothetical protein M3145_08750 [Pseudomonadota bacterium]|nr:hypothetical protein [Pseudomonadota bacterium]